MAIINGKLTCNRCKLPIIDPAYFRISGAIILQEYFDKTPPLYRCKEIAEDYAQSLDMHDDCWRDTLTEYGVPLHDISAILNTMKISKSQKKLSNN